MQEQPEGVFWSASFNMVTGQALVTDRVARSDCGIRWRMAVYPPGAKGALGLAHAIITLWKAVLFGHCRLVYVVCSRSVPGFLRDVPALLPALLGIRVVVHVHGSDLPNLLSSGIIGTAAKYLYRRCEIIVPSAHLIEPLVERSCQNVYLIENFARITVPVRSRHVEQTFCLLWNSNVMASKGIREFVEGVRIARQRGAALSLVVLGRPLADGEATHAEMVAYCEAISCIDWITVRGPVSPEMAELALTEADLVALPSRYPTECQPLAIVQAMCAGCKLIVSDTPALRATLGSYPGWFVEPKPEAIAEALLVAASSNYIDSETRGLAMERFNPDLFDARMAALFRGRNN